MASFAELKAALRAEERDAARFVADVMAAARWREIHRVVDALEAENASLRRQLRNAERDLAEAQA